MRTPSARVLGPLLAVAVLVALAVPALAQQAGTLELAVRESRFEPDGTTAITVNVGGSAKPDILESDAFGVTENGQTIEDVEVEPLLGTGGEVEVAAALLLDTSESMRGAAIEGIRVAGSQLARAVTGDGIPLALIEFNNEPVVLSGPTTDAEDLVALIEPLEAAGGTALYDAVLVGVGELEGIDGVRNIIMLADGEDNGSQASLEEAITAAEDADVAVTVIAYETETAQLEVLEPLAAATGGRFITAADVDQLEGIFAEVAEDVASQYVISYTSAIADTDELDVDITVSTGGATAGSSFVVANGRSEAAVGGASPPPAVLPEPGPLASETALWVATGTGFVGLLLFLIVLLVPRGDREASRTLRHGLTMTERRSGQRQPSQGGGLTASGIAQQALDAISRVPKPEGYEGRVQTELDRAGWQLRTSEYIALRIAGLLGALALFWALTGSLVFGAVTALLGFYTPSVLLRIMTRRRFNAFMSQLPETLQLLSGTLRAGYGIMQGLDTLVKETSPPVSTEFQRVLTEARLGLPLEESLDAMAERIDSDDFRWVVVAMNIQRQVGGNLADLLETVSETLRGREQTRRQIDVLTAEGKLSALILVALPFLLVAYLLVVNPAYLAPLIVNPIGWFLSGGAILLMIAGGFWMSRMIKIDV